MSRKNKLEFTWIGKDRRPTLEPRILVEEPDKSYYAKHRVSDSDIFDNKLEQKVEETHLFAIGWEVDWACPMANLQIYKQSLCRKRMEDDN